MLMCHNSNYTKGRAGSIQHIVLHYTANNGDTAKGNCSYFSRTANLRASAHYFVDEYGFEQSVRESDTAWHCGVEKGQRYMHAHCRNYNSIGIEMCSRKDESGNYYIKPETAANAVALTKKLMAYYNIPRSRILRHYDVTGKTCPAPWVKDPQLWESFLRALSDGTGQPQSTADAGQRRKEEGVKRFQQWLKDSFLRPVVVDGSFGPATKREAVGALQAELNKNYGRKLAVDGSFGPATMAAIFPLHKGHWGTLVYLLQGFLYGKGYVYGGFDGSFGPATDAEVRNFQKYNGLVVDGSAGPATWEKLVK